jgi:23S rRNA (guanosine2251-2'-O)-methyltransferase
VRVADRDDRRVAEVVRTAERGGVRVERVPADVLRHASRGGAHQGVIAEVLEPRAHTVEDLLAAAERPGLFVVLDGVEDPRNLGAILRSCDAAGVDGVIRQTRHAARLDGAAAKTAAGAATHLRIADVVNISRALDELKAAGVWTVGLSGDAERSYDAVDYSAPTAFVMGAEGSGLRRLVRERCDWLVSIPLRGHVESLNVSVAAGIALFEALRQRRAGRPV